MADIADILNGLQSVESNVNNNSLIGMIADIVGNPSDEIASADDPESIYGKIVEMYNEMVAARDSDADITAALQKIVDLSATAESVTSGTPASAELVGTEIQIKVPRGINGANGENGLTPIVEITYNPTTGYLESNVTGFAPLTETPTEEW